MTWAAVRRGVGGGEAPTGKKNEGVGEKAIV